MPESIDRPATRQLANELSRLYDRSNVRTYESLARKLGCSRTKATAILLGQRLPDKEMIASLVDICVDDASQRSQYLTILNRLWEEARAEKRSKEFSQSQSLEDAALDAVGFQKDSLPVTWYANNSEFYSAASEYVRAARERIRVTYVRQAPPTLVTSAEAAMYFDAVLDWAREPGSREVTRIIGAPIIGGKPVESLVQWMRSHHEHTEKIHNYEARVIRWASRGDGLNMALFDDDTSFLAVSGQGGRQQLSGFSVTSGKFIGYLSSYFDQLWATLEPLGRFLEEVS